MYKIVLFVVFLVLCIKAADVQKPQNMSQEDYADFCTAQKIAGLFFKTQNLVNDALAHAVSSVQLIVPDERAIAPKIDYLDRCAPKIDRGLLLKEENGMFGCLVTKWGAWHFAKDRCTRGYVPERIDDLVLNAVHSTIWPIFIDVMLHNVESLKSRFDRIDHILKVGKVGNMDSMQIFMVLKKTLQQLYEKIKNEDKNIELKMCGFNLSHEPIYRVISFDGHQLRDPLKSVTQKDEHKVHCITRRDRVSMLSEHRLYNKEKEWHDAKKFYVEQQK
jgi:hypothetical protein